MCGSKPKTDRSALKFQQSEAARARQEETARQGRVAQGMEQIGGVFAPLEDTLAGRRETLEGFYLPQLDERFSDAQENLSFGLARAGQLTSSTAGKRQGKLGELFGLERAKVDADISADVAATRGRMNSQRSALEAALRSSGDATAATNGALASAMTFREDQPTLNPIGNVFYGIAEGIGGLRDGYEAGRIRRLATPNPMGRGTGRVVGA